MQIATIDCLHADAGFRNFDFVKLTTKDGLIGWSEYNEAFGGVGVTAAIRGLAPRLIGQDPRAYEALVTLMGALRRQSAGGIAQQAIGAIENALLDVKAKALGIPVYELFGGPVRNRIRLYWSHCGTYRVANHATMQIPPVRTLDDITALGREAVASGFTGLKTNVLLLDDNPRSHVPGFARGENFPELTAERLYVDAIRAQLAAFREGTGRDMDILVDLNFNYKTDGFVKMAQAMAEYDLFWVEIDHREPDALRYIREQVPMTLASGECLFGRRDYKPFFEAQAMDVAIIDVPWNGLGESLKIAAMAETAEINVAPHNFYGPLATMMSAHFSAIVPHLQIMETDPDKVPWNDDLVTVKPEIVDGHLLLPTGPGWGTEIDEAALAAHPPKL